MLLITLFQNYILQTPTFLFLCLSNLNPATTEETLTNFVEAGLGNDDADIEEVVYNEDRTIAVLQFSSPVGKFCNHRKFSNFAKFVIWAKLF